MATKKEQMVDFWSERAKEFKNDPRANTNDIWLREIEINYINKIISENAFKKVLDFGCANGYTTKKMVELNPGIQFTGLDINSEMIKAASQDSSNNAPGNIKFVIRNLFEEGRLQENFDFIYCVRVLQNLETEELQKNIIDILCEMLNPGGYLLYIESYQAYYEILNDDRQSLGLEKLPIHKHLTLLTDELDKHAAAKLQNVSQDFIASTYYLVTRLLYSYIAKENNEPIDYNHQIHRIGAMLPQIGEYGPLKAMLFKK